MSTWVGHTGNLCFEPSEFCGGPIPATFVFVPSDFYRGAHTGNLCFLYLAVLGVFVLVVREGWAFALGSPGLGVSLSVEWGVCPSALFFLGA